MQNKKLFEVYGNLVSDLSKISTCKYYHVSAIIVDKKTEKVVSLGYNGTPSKVIECKEFHDFLEFYFDKLQELGEDCPYVNELILEFPELNKYFNSEKYKETLSINKGIIREFQEIENEFRQKALNIYKTKTTLNKYSLAKKYNVVHSKLEIHAEQNALYNVDSDNGKEYYLILSHSPCFECAKLSLLKNVKEIYYFQEYIDPRFNQNAITFLENLGLKTFKIS